jgi:SAM-dependent methyltransferase
MPASTHFYADDIQLYLHELHRVLRPGGTVLATWFLYDDTTLERAVTTSGYPMTHRLDDTTIYNDADDPLRAIAFHERLVRQMVAAAGLTIVTIEHGTWNGGPGPEFQDVVLLRRPAPPVPAAGTLLVRARRVLGRLRRRCAATPRAAERAAGHAADARARLGWRLGHSGGRP